MLAEVSREGWNSVLEARPAHRNPADVAIGLLASTGSVALVTAVVALLERHVPLLSLGVLYVFAVLPVAVGWGIRYALPVAVTSMLAFNWFFLPPRHTFSLRDGANWLALAVYLVTAVVVSELAARSRRRAAVAEQREREAALLASVSSSLLGGQAVEAELERIAVHVAELLHVPIAWITIDAGEPPGAAAEAHPLTVRGRRIGTLHTAPGTCPDKSVGERFLPALASVLAIAVDRAALQHEALETETLRRSDAIKTTVLRAISHDLRSPLTAIAAATEGLRSADLSLDEGDRDELLETIQVEVARLRRVVENLLDLSRLQAGAAEPSLELWSVEEIVGMALADAGDDERVVLDLEEALPPVYVDAGQIRRALFNVLDNALRYSPPGSRVLVQASLCEGAVGVRVSDEGPGIPASERERLFEPFARGPSGTTPGVGLGLAIARGFAAVNGARLSVEPAARGAVLALSLPVARLPAAVPA